MILFVAFIDLSQYGISDIGFADLYLKPERKLFMEFLKPHDTDNLCFLVSKPPLKPKWMDVFNPFQLNVWITVFSSLSICCFLIYLYGHYYPTSEFSGGKGIEMLIAVFFDESHPMSKKLR